MYPTQPRYKARINKVGLTYKKLSELLSVSQPHFTNMLNGDKRLTEKHEERLNKVLTEYEKIIL